MTEVARERAVAGAWYPGRGAAEPQRSLIGIYDVSHRRVFLPQKHQAEPLRVRAAMLAHELSHAAWDVDGVGAELRPADACFQGEARAYKAGIVVYERLRRDAPDDPPSSEVDRYLTAELARGYELAGGPPLAPGALDDLANRHLFLNGYDETCNWR